MRARRDSLVALRRQIDGLAGAIIKIMDDQGIVPPTPHRRPNPQNASDIDHKDPDHGNLSFRQKPSKTGRGAS